MNEKILLSGLSSSFIVNMHYAFQDRDTLFLVLDLLEGGDLRHHISTKRFSEIQSSTHNLRQNFSSAASYSDWNISITIKSSTETSSQKIQCQTLEDMSGLPIQALLGSRKPIIAVIRAGLPAICVRFLLFSSLSYLQDESFLCVRLLRARSHRFRASHWKSSQHLIQRPYNGISRN